jgi:nitroimidazol reductase NimA-like FMN-containing flavoprotein (pyridoxamine 5'-phosphate oxidase superfamily)
MWIDERGSSVLERGECLRLLALGSKERRHGHLGIAQLGAPLVLPLDYAVHGPDVVVRMGEGLFARVEQAELVAFQVDGETGGDHWSVLVRGLARVEDDDGTGVALPVPRIASPGHRLVRIRTDVVSGRRFAAAP